MNKLGWIVALLLGSLLVVGAVRDSGPSDAVVAKLDELKAQQFFLVHSQMFMHRAFPGCSQNDNFPVHCRYVEQMYKLNQKKRDDRFVEAVGAKGTPGRDLLEELHARVFADFGHPLTKGVCDLNYACLDLEAAMQVRERLRIQEAQQKK